MSTLRLTTLSNQGGTASVPSDTVINGTAKAWVNFNGTGTVAIRASFNVSSITDLGTGTYRINFSTAMPDSNYSAVYGVAATNPYENDGTRTASSYQINTENNSYTMVDISQINVSIFR
jgi:hypothetical protein